MGDAVNKTSIEWTDYTAGLIKSTHAGGPVSFDEWEARRILRTRTTGKHILMKGDPFEEDVPDEMLDRMFAVFALRPDLVFQVLTKRPERMRAYFSTRDTAGAIAVTIREVAPDGGLAAMRAMGTHVLRDVVQKRWPLPNVWLGTSVENQATADERIPELLATPAAVRFLSCEPLLEGLDLEPWLATGLLHWVICGGES